MRPKRSELETLYGEIVNGIWIDQPKWMMTLTIPGALWPFWKFNGKECHTIYIHKEMANPLYNVWTHMMRLGTAKYIESFDGCFAIRNSRRNSKLSVHSFGLAIDLNAATNPLGAKPTISLELVKSFELAGFVWGGRWAHPDGMHFQYVDEA